MQSVSCNFLCTDTKNRFHSHGYGLVLHMFGIKTSCRLGTQQLTGGGVVYTTGCYLTVQHAIEVILLVIDLYHPQVGYLTGEHPTRRPPMVGCPMAGYAIKGYAMGGYSTAPSKYTLYEMILLAELPLEIILRQIIPL